LRCGFDVRCKAEDLVMTRLGFTASKLFSIACLFVASLCAAVEPGVAAEVLINGNLETGAGIPSWTINTFLSDSPTTAVPNVYEHNDGSNNPAVAGLGIVLHPQVGNTGIYTGQDRRVNFVMEQTYTGAAVGLVAGRTFTFSGDVALQHGYSGVVENLTPLYPIADYNSNFVVDTADYTVWRDNLNQEVILPNEGPTPGIVDQEDYTEWKNRFGQMGHGAIPSPTVTKFEMEFLDDNNNLLGAATPWDLRDGEGLDAYRTGIDKVTMLAPANSRKVRVRVSALDMQDNCCDGGQDVLFDNFILNDGAQGTGNRLGNGDLNTPGAPVGWTLVEGPVVNNVTADSAAFIGFANRKVEDTTPPIDAAGTPTGSQGLWLRPFVNATQFEPDIADVFATLSQTVPANPGAEYDFSAWTAWEAGYSGGLPNTTTQTFLRIEFLNGSTVIGTQNLDLKAAGMLNDEAGGLEFDDWKQFTVSATAPLNTTNVRVSAGATGMYNTTGAQSAFFDEFSLIETLAGAGGFAAVPEPSTIVLLGVAICFWGRRSRRI
jgi:hypothetical protein